MRRKVLLSGVLCLAASLPLSQANVAIAAPSHAAAPAPHAAAPAPHVAAAPPHMAAPVPHVAAAPPPRMAAPVPHMAAAPQHFSAPPRMAAAPQHFSAPPHMAAAPQHFSAPQHMAAAPQHFAAPQHMAAAPQHFSAPQHMAAAPQHFAAPQHMAAAPQHMAAAPQHLSAPSHIATAQHMSAAPHGAEAQHVSQSPHLVDTKHSASSVIERPGAAQHTVVEPNHMTAGSHGMQPAMQHSAEPQQTSHAVSQPQQFQHAPGKMSPVTTAFPVHVQEAHQQAMSQLRQGHPAEQTSQANHFNTQRVAGAAAGLAVTGLAAHQLAAQQPNEPREQNRLNVENGAHPQQSGNRIAEVPGGRQPGQQPNANVTAGGTGTRAGQRGGHAIAPGTRGAAGTFGVKNVPQAPGYANPRLVSSSRPATPVYSNRPSGLLSYRAGAHLFPQGGNKQKGVPGIIDPGGYIRTPQTAGTRINRQYAAQQLASIPNYQANMALNGNNIVRNQGSWPWQVPQPSAWWNPWTWGQQSNNPYQYQANQLAYNPGYGYNYGGIQPGFGSSYGGEQYDPYAGINPYAGYPYGLDGSNAYWNGWNNYGAWDSWNNDYANAEPFYGGGSSGPLGFLGNLFGGGGGSVGSIGAPTNWLSNLLYFTGYSEGGNTYPDNYFAMNGYAPTPYVFNVASGQFWQPGAGYCDYLPNGYQAPITVAVQEVVPTFDGNQNITGYQPQTFYYNAIWDTDAQAYGYYDYRSKFHWVTFPWQANNFGRQIM